MIEHVLLFSGGMDSTTLLALVLEQASSKEILCLTATYGSLHEGQEMAAARRVTEHYGVKWETVSLPSYIFGGGESSLLGQAEIPSAEYQDVKIEGPSNTIVPFRNGILTALAVAKAASIGAKRVWSGQHASDHAHWAYPDCSPEFLGAMTAAVYAGTASRVRLATPFVWIEKGGLVAMAAIGKAPLHLTWSCYRGGELHCGTCPTCLERLSAFASAGYIDPVEYANGRGDAWPNDCEGFPI